ncbi:MAG TPA: PH domain-containing protein [Nocardioidaceae bacterium]|nr:PH domain-containing protein [Nocardioidaceae bacterium]
MPAGSEHLPELPHRYRPLGVRFAGYLCGGLLITVCLVVWIAFPPEVRAKFTAFQLITIIALAGGAATCGYALTRSRVDVRADGITVVNGFKRRDLEWTEILAVTLKPGSPWVVLDLSDGTAVSAMGIQASDGLRATRHVKELRVLVEANSKTPRND